jgi:hypothetical protein
VANDDSQSIELKGDILTGAASVTVSGNIIAGGTAGDVADTSADGTVTLVSVAGQFFTDSVTPIVITTNFGQLSIDSSGAYIYTSQEGVALPDDVVTESFAYVIEDGDARLVESDTATLTINLTPELVNIAPVAQDDSFSLLEGTEVSGNVITHIDNNDGEVDTDADGDDRDLKITHVEGFAISGNAIFKIIDGVLSETTAAEILLNSTFIGTNDNGILRINTNGAFTYENKGFLKDSSAPSFEYTLSDGIDIHKAVVTINVDTNAPIANDDVATYIFDEDKAVTVEGNVTGLAFGRGSTDQRDNFGNDGPGSPAVTQVEYLGVVYTLDANNTSGNRITISTEFGYLSIDNKGGYKFTEEGLTSDEVGKDGISLEFTYIIQDGDLVNPDQDSAILTINIKPPQQPDSQPNDLDIHFNQTSGTIDTGIDTQELSADKVAFAYSPDTYDLGNILTDGHTGGLEKYLAEMAGDDGAMVNIDQAAVLNNVQAEESIVLEKGEVVSKYASLATVSNGLLAEGAIIISDAAEATSAPIAELDSTELS